MRSKETIILLSVILTSCNFSDETKNLSGGWIFVDEGGHNKVIDKGEIYIPCEVRKYGYNNDFIMAAQKPTKDCFLGRDTVTYEEGKDKTYYWLIVHKGDLLLGPLNKSEFKKARQKYRVPEDLELESIY